LGGFPETADVETSSEDYAGRFSGAVGAWFLKVQEDATLHMLSPHAGASVIDVGGGLRFWEAQMLVRRGLRNLFMTGAAPLMSEISSHCLIRIEPLRSL